MRPDAATIDPDDYLRERYVGEAGSRSPALKAYYALKPLLPRPVQLAARRAYAPRQAARDFPRWPVEPLLVDHRAAVVRRELEASRAPRLPMVNFWPGRARFAAVLTHDVEGPGGVERIERVRAIERAHGLRSAWYFVAEDYPVDRAVLDRLREEGCEVGLHGIHHDGRLFSSRERFEAELPKIHHYLAAWEAVGFRSPATHRNAEWMPELGCLYDSSYSDTAPFEPQPGGCCSVLPYFLDELVELPMTLVMDHTLWEILRDVSPRPWIEKAEWVAAQHGLVNLLVHPDYVVTARREQAYATFVEHLASMPGAWHALPREVAAWWRARAALEPADLGPAQRTTALDGSEARLAWARATEDGVRFEVAEGP